MVDPFENLYKHIESVDKNQDGIIFSIIIPVHNEENTIGSIIRKLPEKKYIEIIVVDDKSEDNSIEKIKEVKKDRKVKLLRNKKNLGYGQTLVRGMRASVGEIIITMDADGQHLPEDIYNIIKPILDDRAEMTVGSRYLGANYYNLKTSTRLGEALVEKMIQLFFGTKIMNNQSGFRGFKRNILHIFDQVKYPGYAFATEVIIIGALYKYRIEEVPIRVRNRQYGTSGVRVNKLAMNIFSCVLIYIFKKLLRTFYKKEINFLNLRLQKE